MMQAQGRSPKQSSLSLPEAEAAFQERLSDLHRAVVMTHADLYVREFLKLIFFATAGGVSGALQKTYAEIAATGQYGLCCPISRVRRTVHFADRKHLVIVREARDRNGSLQANRYEINWMGIRAILGHHPAMAGHSTSAQGEQTSAQGEQTSAQGEQTSAQGELHTKEYNSSCISSSDSFYKKTGPDRSARAQAEPDRTEPIFFEADEQSKFQAQRRTQSPDPRTALRRTNFSNDPRPGEGDVLRAVLLEKIPELAEAEPRTVAPLPVGGLIHGVFQSPQSPITMATLKNSLLLAEWFRRQLSLDLPLCGHTEADLLLVFAAAEYALALRPEDVIKNRVAAFCAQVSRKKWRQVLPFVQSARKRLDGLQRVYGDVLHCEAWPPAAAMQPQPSNREEQRAAAEQPQMTAAQWKAAKQSSLLALGVKP